MPAYGWPVLPRDLQVGDTVLVFSPDRKLAAADKVVWCDAESVMLAMDPGKSLPASEFRAVFLARENYKDADTT